VYITRKLLALIPVAIAVLLFAASCTAGVDNKQDKSNQQEILNINQPNHIYLWSYQRSILQQIEDFQATQIVDTWSVWVSDFGEPMGMCPSKGFPISYTTQLTNPRQEVGDKGAVIDLADPIGVYPVGTSDATWVLCLIDGKAYPQRLESKVNTYIYPVKIIFNPQTGKKELARDGDPSGTAQIDLTQPDLSTLPNQGQ